MTSRRQGSSPSSSDDSPEEEGAGRRFGDPLTARDRELALLMTPSPAAYEAFLQRLRGGEERNNNSDNIDNGMSMPPLSLFVHRERNNDGDDNDETEFEAYARRARMRQRPSAEFLQAHQQAVAFADAMTGIHRSTAPEEDEEGIPPLLVAASRRPATAAGPPDRRSTTATTRSSDEHPQDATRTSIRTFRATDHQQDRERSHAAERGRRRLSQIAHALAARARHDHDRQLDVEHPLEVQATLEESLPSTSTSTGRASREDPFLATTGASPQQQEEETTAAAAASSSQQQQREEAERQKQLHEQALWAQRHHQQDEHDDSNNDSQEEANESSLQDDEQKPAAAVKPKTKSVLETLTCPITLELPLDPVMAEDGVIYERSAMEQHLQNSDKSPVKNIRMGNSLIESHQVKSMIESLVENASEQEQGLVNSYKERLAQQKIIDDLVAQAQAGDVQVMIQVGENYYEGKNGFDLHQERGFHWYHKAADEGSVVGMALAGIHLLQNASSTDMRRRLSRISKQNTGLSLVSNAAHEHGSDRACIFLGEAIADEKYFLERNVKRAIKLLQLGVSGDCEYLHASEETIQRARRRLSELSAQPPAASRSSSSRTSVPARTRFPSASSPWDHHQWFRGAFPFPPGVPRATRGGEHLFYSRHCPQCNVEYANTTSRRCRSCGTRLIERSF